MKTQRENSLLLLSLIHFRDEDKKSTAVPAAEERTEVCGPVVVWQSSQQ